MTMAWIASLISASAFQFVLVGSQLALVLSVVVLLVIWWLEWRSGRIW